MKNLSLPQHINMLRLSELAVDFSGSLLIKDMQRLLPSLHEDSGEVLVKLYLGCDEDATRFCRVELKTEVVLQCQRCMDPYTYGIISDFVHGIVASESEAETLAGHYEPVIAEDGLLRVRDMIEDELILKMPIVPMHEEAACRVKALVQQSDQLEEKVREKAQSPFEVLKTLKQDLK